MSRILEPPVPIAPVKGRVPERIIVTADDVMASSTTLEDAKLSGIALRTAIVERIIEASVEWTIEGASTVSLSIHDPDYRLRDSGILHRETKLTFAGQAFVLVKEGGKGSTCKLVFEDALVALLRQNRKPKRAARGKVTRGQFMVGMAREEKTLRGKVVAPEQNVMLKLASASGSGTADRTPGFPPKVKVTVKGKRANAEQLKVLADVLDVGVSLKAPGKVNEAAIACVIQESTARNLRDGDRDSAGAFQQRPSQGWGTYAQVRDVRRAARSFYVKAIAYHRTHKSASIANIAQHVQRSAFPSAYQQWAAEAKAILKAYVPDGGGGGSSSRRLEYTRGAPGGPKRENTWDALLRLADEVGWRRWAYRGRLYIMSEEYLYASQPWATIERGAEYVLEDPDYDVDVGKRAAEVTLSVRAARWATPPGAIIQLEGYGRALDGRWLVSKAGRPLIGADASIAQVTLVKPRPELPEPVEAEEGADGGDSGSAEFDKMLAKMTSVSAKRWAYKWGGGHGSFAGPYDCSGGVSAVLNAGGFLSSPQTTVGLASFGESGEGEMLTVWVKNVADARKSHVFLEVKEPGKPARHWGTGEWGSGFSGAGFKPQMHGKDGFSPRHPKGL